MQLIKTVVKAPTGGIKNGHQSGKHRKTISGRMSGLKSVCVDGNVMRQIDRL